MHNIIKKLNSPKTKKILAFLDQGLVSGSNFLIGILLVRAVGLDVYGVFALAWMAVLFAVGLNQAFITKPLLSIAPKLNKEEQSEYFSDLHIIQIVFSSMALLIGFFFFQFVGQYFFSANIVSLIPLISGIIFCQLLHDFYRKISFVRSDILFVISIDVVLYIGQLCLVLLCFYRGYFELRFILLAILLANILSICVGMVRMIYRTIRRENVYKVLVRHMHFSKWLLGTAVLQWFSGNYFIVVGGALLGTAAVGAVRMVQNVFGLCHILFLTMESLVPVDAARHFQEQGYTGLVNYLQKMTFKIAPAVILFLLFIVVFASPILKLFYGSGMNNYPNVVFAYALLYLFVFLGHPFRYYMRTIEATLGIFVAYVFTTVFSLFFAKMLIDSFSMDGMLIGLVFTQVISLIVYYFFIVNLRKKAELLTKYS